MRRSCEQYDCENYIFSLLSVHRFSFENAFFSIFVEMDHRRMSSRISWSGRVELSEHKLPSLIWIRWSYRPISLLCSIKCYWVLFIFWFSQKSERHQQQQQQNRNRKSVIMRVIGCANLHLYLSILSIKSIPLDTERYWNYCLSIWTRHTMTESFINNITILRVCMCVERYLNLQSLVHRWFNRPPTHMTWYCRLFYSQLTCFSLERVWLERWMAVTVITLDIVTRLCDLAP